MFLVMITSFLWTFSLREMLYVITNVSKKTYSKVCIVYQSKKIIIVLAKAGDVIQIVVVIFFGVLLSQCAWIFISPNI